jgi:UDP-N-acetylmuramoyl-tripeptide--D-alanyl-D-alanine ligase
MMWTSEEAAKATGGKTQGTWQASRVEIDSRKVKPGDLFVAIKGENFDGHDFVKDALAKGAAAAMVSSSVDEGNLLIVKDTLKGLEALGKHARKRSRAQVVGVTGSVGKTSAKEMLKLALSAHGSVFATAGNYNNHIGTPLNLANLPADAKFAVFEMGMNHAGEIAHLTKMVEPDIAVITNVEAVHLEFFKSVEDIARAKAEIFDGISSNGVAVLNKDNAHLTFLKGEARERGIKQVVTFGENAGADSRLISYEASAEGSKVSAEISGKTLNYTLAAIGKHWAEMSVMALSVTHLLGLDDHKTAKALSAFSEPEGRGNIVRIPAAGGEATLIDDSYNASPTAMKAAFAKTALVWESEGGKGRKLAALGDMLELGDNAAALHAGLATELRMHRFDKIFLAGAQMKQLYDALPAEMRGVHVKEAKDLMPKIIKELCAGDLLLVKGSHGSHMYEVAQALRALPKEKKHAV